MELDGGVNGLTLIQVSQNVKRIQTDAQGLQISGNIKIFCLEFL